MKITAKADMRGFAVTKKRWQKVMNSQAVTVTKEEAVIYAREMARCTPPGNHKQPISKSLKQLKARIKEDLLGRSPGSIVGGDIVTRRLKSGPQAGQLVAEVKNVDQSGVGPFYVHSAGVRLPAFARKQIVRDVGAAIKARAGAYAIKKVGKAYRLCWHGRRLWATRAAIMREVRRRQKLAGSLMAGWKALAHKGGGMLQAQLEKKQGKGRAVLRKAYPNGVVIDGFNRGNYPDLQRIVDRQMPYLQAKKELLAKKHAKKIAKKLK